MNNFTFNNGELLPYEDSYGHPPRRVANSRRPDPFMSMSADGFFSPHEMMLQPFSSAGTHSMFDSMRHRQQQMMQQFMGGFGGMSADLMHSPLHNPLNSMGSSMTMSSSSFGNGEPNGTYQSSVTVINSSVGADGKRHVEKYAKTAAGNSAHKMREVKEAYTNSKIGIDKMALQREMNGRGRRVVKERNQNTGEIVTNDEVIGMERNEETFKFDKEWNEATPYLPKPTLPAASLRGLSADQEEIIYDNPRGPYSLRREPQPQLHSGEQMHHNIPSAPHRRQRHS